MKSFKIRKRNSGDYFAVSPSSSKRSPVTLTASGSYELIEYDYPVQAARSYAEEILALCDSIEVGVSFIIEERP